MAERLFQADAEPANLIIAGGRLVDPTAGFHGEAVDLRIENGRIAEIGARPAPSRRRDDRRGRAHRHARPGRSARAPAHAGRRGRGGHRLGHARGRGRRASSPSWRCRTPRRSSTPRAVLAGLIDQARSEAVVAHRVHVRDHARPRGSRPDRDGRARRGRRRGLLGRRPAGRRRRHPAAGAPVQPRHRPAAGAARGGHLALGRRPDARGRRLGRARPARLAGDRREHHDRPRPRHRPPRGRRPAHLPRLGRRVGGRDPPRARAAGRRCRPRSRRTICA